MLCVRKHVMNKTETVPCPHGAQFVLLVLKCKAAADPPPAPFALRATWTHSGHNI